MYVRRGDGGSAGERGDGGGGGGSSGDWNGIRQIGWRR